MLNYNVNQETVNLSTHLAHISMVIKVITVNINIELEAIIHERTLIFCMFNQR